MIIAEERHLHCLLFGQTVATTPGSWRDVLRADPCAYCGRKDRWARTIDHIDPEHAGPGQPRGSSGFSNSTAACSHCNRQKARAPMLMYLLYRRVRDRDLLAPRVPRGWPKDWRVRAA